MSPEQLSGVGDNGGDNIATKSEEARTRVINSSRTGSFNFRLPTEQSIRDRVNTLLVVALLVATVTFSAGFTIPGGNRNSASNKDEGMATMLTDHMFQVFVICDTIAMYSATLIAVCLIWAQLGDSNLVHTTLRLALRLLAVALTMMSLAFMAGVYVVVSPLHWLAFGVLISGMLFIFIVFVVFTPLFFNTTSKFPILRHITYYLLCMEVLVSGSRNTDLEEDW